MLPFIWTVFVVAAVGAFIVIGAYWLDVQDRPDLTFRSRVAWSAGALLFPLPAVALALFAGFVLGVFR